MTTPTSKDLTTNRPLVTLGNRLQNFLPRLEKLTAEYYQLINERTLDTLESSMSAKAFNDLDRALDNVGDHLSEAIKLLEEMFPAKPLSRKPLLPPTSRRK
jgi:hypothetical protein